MNHFQICLAAAAFTLFAGGRTVHADPVLVTGYSVLGVNEHVSYAGRIDNEYADVGQVTLQTGAGNILSWCTDLFDTLAPGVFTTGLLRTDQNGYGTALTSSQLAEIGGLINVGDRTATTAQVAAAFQNAIWSVEYGPSFSFVSDDPTVAGLTDVYLHDAENGTFDPAGIVTQLTSPGDQGQATTAVPEPGSLALLASSLFCLRLLGARFKYRFFFIHKV